MKEGRKPEYPEKTPGDELQKMIKPDHLITNQVIVCLCCYCFSLKFKRFNQTI